MAASEILYIKSQKKSCSISTVLAYAALEWLLICMLSIIAVFSFLIAKFTCHCELQTRCLLCSRLDNIFGNGKWEYYWDLMCGNQEVKISSLVICHAHDNLVDVHEMCESCLLSLAMINKSNAETYKSSVDRLGEDSRYDLHQDPLIKGHISGIRHCSCCNEPLIQRGCGQKLMLAKSPASETAHLHVPLSGAVGRDQNNLKKNKQSVECMQREISSITQPSSLVSQVHSDVIETHGATSRAYALEIGQVDCEDPSAHSELITLHDVPPSSNARETPVEASKESNIISLDDVPPSSDARGASFKASESDTKITPVRIPEESGLTSLVDFLPSSNRMETSVQELKESSVAITKEVLRTSVTNCEKICKAENRPATTIEEANPLLGDNGLQVHDLLDSGDAYKLANGNGGKQLSDVLAERLTRKDSTRDNEDLKLLHSQLSAAQEQSINDASPEVLKSPSVSMSRKLSVNSDESKASDASGAVGMQIFLKGLTLERNDSGKSLDGSIISEIEGESEVDRLKRQVEHDKKLMSALYRELEEERNASEIAANEAMAMITRLQDEKATFHMEDLQCLRMMEEQAVYYMEELQKTNELLAEKEKEVQDLEVELEFYRSKFPTKSM